MESFEILKQAVNNLGVKSIAADMNLSTSLIYKWCQPKDTPDAAGADNPLDRIAKIYDLTGDDTPVRWLCDASRRWDSYDRGVRTSRSRAPDGR